MIHLPHTLWNSNNARAYANLNHKGYFGKEKRIPNGLMIGRRALVASLARWVFDFHTPFRSHHHDLFVFRSSIHRRTPKAGPLNLGPGPSHSVPAGMFRTLSNIISSITVRSLSTHSLARSASTLNNTGERVLAIALGSNLGDKVRNIETALRILETQHGIHVIDTSFLYESSSMYIKDQPAFVNGACLVKNPPTKLPMRF